jgi:hypothetical protein
MLFSDYLREQAEKYRKLAEATETPPKKSFSNWRQCASGWPTKRTTGRRPVSLDAMPEKRSAVMALAGPAAEELFFGEPLPRGADATDLANAMRYLREISARRISKPPTGALVNDG